MGNKQMLVIEPDGSIRPPAGRPDGLADRAGTYEVITSPPGLLILKRDQATAADHHVLMSGEIVTDTTMLEIINVIATCGWTGQLLMHAETGERRLGIDQGALRWATSRAVGERLGEVMTAMGAMNQGQLDLCLEALRPGRRLGEIAVDLGFISRQGLFDLLGQQATMIFQNSLSVDNGSYCFTVAARDESEDMEGPGMTLHLPIQGLLMESMRRMDEMAEYRQRVGKGDVVPVLTDRAARISLTDDLKPIALLCDGKRSIVDIATRLHMDEFDATKLVSHMVEKGLLKLQQPTGFEREKLGQMLRDLNETVRMITDTAGRHADAGELVNNLELWVSVQLDDLFGTELEAGGAVPVEPTLDRMEAMGSDDPTRELYLATQQMVSFALFSASALLPREVERTLSKRVNRRLSRRAD